MKNSKLAPMGLAAIVVGGVAYWQFSTNQTGKIGGEAVTLFESYGNWEALCDALPDQPETARCYVRLVDVYSQRPDFGAYVGFITPQTNGDLFQLSLEPGSSLSNGGLSVRRGEELMWSIDEKSCNGNVCDIKGADLESFIGASSAELTIRVEFKDRDGKDWQRELSGEALSKAYQVYRKAVDAMAKGS